jgi:hypothetical protein
MRAQQRVRVGISKEAALTHADLLGCQVVQIQHRLPTARRSARSSGELRSATVSDRQVMDGRDIVVYSIIAGEARRESRIWTNWKTRDH